MFRFTCLILLVKFLTIFNMPLVYTRDLPVYTFSIYIDFICGLFA